MYERASSSNGRQVMSSFGLFPSAKLLTQVKPNYQTYVLALEQDPTLLSHTPASQVDCPRHAFSKAVVKTVVHNLTHSHRSICVRTQSSRFARLVTAIVAASALLGCAVQIPPDLQVLAPSAPSEHPGPDTVHVRYFGVSTLMFTSDGHSSMIDGFFSRPSLAKLLFGPVKPDRSRIRAALSAGDVRFRDEGAVASQDSLSGRLPLQRLFVAHSHFDHAMDVGVVAELTNARISGSESTAQIAREQSATVRMEVHADEALVHDDQSPFKTRIFKVDHGPTPFFIKFPGMIDGPIGTFANMGSYREGGNYAYWICHRALSVLVVPSADASIKIPEGATGAVDIVFLGIGRLGKQSPDYVERYWNAVVVKSGASMVIPIHWDDFTKSLDQDLVPLQAIADNMAASISKLQQLAGPRRQQQGLPPVNLRLLPLFKPVMLTATNISTHSNRHSGCAHLD